jgi:hypothetical protein
MINVKLKTRENIDVQLQPKQGIKIDSSNKYLFDPTLMQGYVDLTKDYSDKAMQSEANAKASEMNAELSAEEAKQSELNAKQSEVNAKNSETIAKVSEQKAIQEANASAESAYQSQQSALASYQYSSNAEADAQNVNETLGLVLEAQTKATQSEQNAKTSEQNAKQSETNAKASETKATQEANASAESAYQSQQSALASAEYASNAESDAQNANESLDNVLVALDNVLASEQKAKASETNAKASENNAKSSETKAINSEKIAKEKADEASQFALECQAIKDSLGSVYVFKGSVNTESELPNNAQVGDVYDAKDTGVNYAWTGTEWDALGVTLDFDLSDYATKEYVNTTEQEIIENYMEADTALQTQVTGLSSALDTAQDNIVSINGKISDSASSTNKLISNSELFNATQSVRSDFADADAELQIQINGQATAIAGKQDKLVSGTNIKTVNGESVLGSGNILIKSAPDLDNKTINKNASSQLQTIGVIDQRTSSAVKTWTGTKAQYDALSTKDSNTLYNITDDESNIVNTINDLINTTKNQFNTLLNSLYPVNSVYLSTSSTCPLASLISGSTWQQLGTSLITSVNTDVPIKGDGKTLGFTNGTTNYGLCGTGQSNYLLGISAKTDYFNSSVTSSGSGQAKVDGKLGITTDSSKSGIVGTVTRTSISVYIFKRTA